MVEMLNASQLDGWLEAAAEPVGLGRAQAPAQLRRLASTGGDPLGGDLGRRDEGSAASKNLRRDRLPRSRRDRTISAGDVRHITADSARLREELQWRPRVDFATGMAELARARRNYDPEPT
jgi:nucleoside-diphosphate-sugar epimerase